MIVSQGVLSAEYAFGKAVRARFTMMGVVSLVQIDVQIDLAHVGSDGVATGGW